MNATTLEEVEPGETGKAILVDDLWQPLPNREPVEFVNGSDEVLHKGVDVFLVEGD